MSIRIRVYPNNGMGAMGAMGMGMGMYGSGGAVSAQTYFTQKLNTQQQVSNLRLNYERALWNERLDKVRLEERLKNPYAMMGQGMMAPGMMAPGMMGGYPAVAASPYAAYGAYGSPMLGASMLGGYGNGFGGGMLGGLLGGLGRWV